MLSIAYDWLYIDKWLDNKLFTKSVFFESLKVRLEREINSKFALTIIANELYHFLESKKPFQNCLRS